EDATTAPDTLENSSWTIILEVHTMMFGEKEEGESRFIWDREVEIVLLVKSGIRKWKSSTGTIMQPRSSVSDTCSR
ncbi:MAG: hypothetical protein EBX37_16795, partial [Alphaproteobacteria bacterium]|nr:hypothetical protein [Alphaproteobacteria bacterium]